MIVARTFAGILCAAVLAAGTAAFAQQVPAQSGPPPDAQSAPPPPPPSYARPAVPNGEEVVSGRIVSFDGKYHLVVNDDRGFADNVEMRQGTIINPTGLQLAPGMRVTIAGYNRGSYFAANQIDTPYTQYGFAYPAYPVVPYGAYPYPGWGYGGLSIGIGFGGYGHFGGYGGYGYHWH